MKRRNILLILLLLVGASYILEQYVLVGRVLLNATVTISYQNRTPGVVINVIEGGGDVTVYLKSDDLPITYTVVGPDEAIIEEHMVSLGRHDFSFDAPYPGVYLVTFESEAEDGSIGVSAWANDKRLFYGLHF